jgi:Peptidase M15
MRMGQQTTEASSAGRLNLIFRHAIFTFLGLIALAFAVAAPAAAEGDSSEWVKGVFGNSDAANRGSRLGGPASGNDRSSRRGSKGVQVASLGTTRNDASPSRRAPVTGGGNINWVASAGCLDGSLRSVLSNLASNFGSLTVSSTCRSGSHNRRVGGAPRSMHLSGDAADFRIHSNVGAAYASLRSNGSVGGLKHYGGGLFHIDTGARRSW